MLVVVTQGAKTRHQGLLAEAARLLVPDPEDYLTVDDVPLDGVALFQFEEVPDWFRNRRQVLLRDFGIGQMSHRLFLGLP